MDKGEETYLVLSEVDPLKKGTKGGGERKKNSTNRRIDMCHSDSKPFIEKSQRELALTKLLLVRLNEGGRRELAGNGIILPGRIYEEVTKGVEKEKDHSGALSCEENEVGVKFSASACKPRGSGKRG